MMPQLDQGYDYQAHADWLSQVPKPKERELSLMADQLAESSRPKTELKKIIIENRKQPQILFLLWTILDLHATMEYVYAGVAADGMDAIGRNQFEVAIAAGFAPFIDDHRKRAMRIQRLQATIQAQKLPGLASAIAYMSGGQAVG